MDSCQMCPTERRAHGAARPPHWTFDRGANEWRVAHAIQMLAMRRQPIRKGSADYGMHVDRVCS